MARWRRLTIILAEVWMSTSVFAILLLAGLMALPKEPIEAARVDGCNPLQVFRHITLPFLMPFVYIAMTIRSLDVARAYDMVQIMTNGGPAGRTELLWTLMTRTGYQNARWAWPTPWATSRSSCRSSSPSTSTASWSAARAFMGGAQ